MVLNGRKLLFVIFVILLMAGAFFAYRAIISRKSASQLAEQKQQKITAQAEFIKSIQQARGNDKDLDGLTDAEEEKYGTDANLTDTDGDGLTDLDEVTIYKTNPLKSDTFGIGKTDGYGARQGMILPGGKINREAAKMAATTTAPATGGSAPTSSTNFEFNNFFR